jgi:hypothetical protein
MQYSQFFRYSPKPVYGFRQILSPTNDLPPIYRKKRRLPFGNDNVHLDGSAFPDYIDFHNNYLKVVEDDVIPVPQVEQAACGKAKRSLAGPMPAMRIAIHARYSISKLPGDAVIAGYCTILEVGLIFGSPCQALRAFGRCIQLRFNLREE